MFSQPFSISYSSPLCVLPLSTLCCSSFSALSMFCTRHITILGFHSPDVGCMQDSRKHHRLSILRTLFRISLMWKSTREKFSWQPILFSLPYVFPSPAVVSSLWASHWESTVKTCIQSFFKIWPKLVNGAKQNCCMVVQRQLVHMQVGGWVVGSHHTTKC